MNTNYDYCYSCDSCNYCNYCNYCNSCNYCNYCDYCDYCNYCNYCNYCYSCDSCKNLKMTEYNIFCYSKNYNDDSSFQQKRYRAFNKEVGQNRYNQIVTEVRNILSNPKLKLTDFWKQITDDQWKRLLAIPEAQDFKEGFEYISGQKINLDDTVEIRVEGKAKRISRMSAKELGFID